jgi:osmoprotectant transport system substrate-binding protein
MAFGRKRRGAAFGVGLLALVLLVAGCDREAAPPPPEDPRRPVIELASFDFSESELLAEVYGQALAQHGYPVEQVVQLGSREVVAPALEQGKVDMVPEYLGSALNFLNDNDRDRVATADPALTHARLEQAFAPRGVSVLAYAPAQDRNGFVVTGDLAREHGLETISDLAPLAPQLSIGGPPECPERPLCLQGLQDVYQLRFARFKPMPTRDVTAAELDSGEIDVGMLDTTNPHLIDNDLVQLKDDRQLQPAENVVPVIRREVLDVYGPALVRLCNAVSAKLTTTELTRLNLEVMQGRPPADAASGWLRANTIIG